MDSLSQPSTGGSTNLVGDSISSSSDSRGLALTLIGSVLGFFLVKSISDLSLPLAAGHLLVEGGLLEVNKCLPSAS